MGTACAIVLAEKPDQNVTIWARNPDFAEAMSRDRENIRLLPGIPIPDSIEITSDLAAAVQDANMLVASIPTAYLRKALALHKDILPAVPVVSVIKGLENETFLRPSEIVTDSSPSKPEA